MPAYLFFAGQTRKCTAGLPVRNHPPGVLIRREETHNPAGHNVTDVGEDAACLIHLSKNKYISLIRSSITFIGGSVTMEGESLFWKVKSSSWPEGPLQRTMGRMFSGGITWPAQMTMIKRCFTNMGQMKLSQTHSVVKVGDSPHENSVMRSSSTPAEKSSSCLKSETCRQTHLSIYETTMEKHTLEADIFLTGCMVPPAIMTARHSFRTWAKWTAGFSSRNLTLLSDNVATRKQSCNVNHIT